MSIESGGKEFRGYVQVYTGNGKGKTTAALGLAFRAAGHGMKTYIGQFLKGQHYGEIDAAAMISPLIRIERFGREGFVHVVDGPDDEDFLRARKGLQKCREAMLSGDFSIIVLDEINTAVLLKLLTEQDVLEILDTKPDNVEIVLTGRSASPAVIERADLVTEMNDIKHYYEKGVKARTGIEK
jgi:cob(I)alamin adenosyltransferase